MSKRIDTFTGKSVADVISAGLATPEPVAPQAFTDARAAVDALRALYDRNTAFLRDAFHKVAKGEVPPQRFRAFYPELRFSTASFAHVDTRLAYGHVSLPGEYATTLTRPDLFDSYLLEQIRLLIKNHGVPVTVQESSTPIPRQYR
jgi:AMP nucleosidase